MLFLHFGSYLEKYWVNSDKIKCILSKKLEKFNESDIFQVSEIFQGFLVCFGTDAFQYAILYQKESYLILYLMI